jgi:hypothetical protein
MGCSSLRRITALLAALGLALVPPAARAAKPAQVPDHELLAAPTSITASGGVSMGAYEAGLLHYSLAWLRANAQRSELKEVTGASAGSVNAVLAVLAQCGYAQETPTESLYWRVWVPLGLNQLFVESQVSRQAAFSRAWFEATAEDIERRWTAGLRESCDVVLGFSATRVVPRGGGIGATESTLTVPRIEERFVLRVQGRGQGRTPRLTNYSEVTGIGDPLLLPEEENGEVPFTALRDLLFASTAFPVAFAPVELAHCPTKVDGGKPGRCPKATASRALFVDGGLFDNTPLALAVSTAAAGLRETKDGKVRWLDRADASQGRLPPRLNFIYVETDVTAYPVALPKAKVGPDTSLMALLGRISGAFLATARSKNLYTLVEQMPAASEHIRATARHFPAASSPMVAFLGFFEQEFRRYDFYLGMYDARRLLRDRFIPRTGIPAEAFSFPEMAPGAGADWHPFACLRALFDGQGDSGVACAGPELEDIRILAQVSLDRLYEECRHNVPDPSLPIAHPQCRAASEGGEPAHVPGVTPLAPGAWQKREGESEITWVVRLLASHGFRFRDLGAERPEDALARIRLRMGDVVAATAHQQPGLEDAVVGRAGEMGANALLYVPSPNHVWVALGRELELGYSRGFPRSPEPWSRFRLHLAFQVEGPYAPVSSDEQPWGLMPVAGASFRLPGFGSQAFQLSALARGGYLFARGDDFGSGRCTTDGKPIGSCSGAVVQGGFSAEGLEFLFLRLMAEWYAPGSRWAFAPMLGVQLAF